MTASAVREAAITLGNRMTLAGRSNRSSRPAARSAPQQQDTVGRDLVEVGRLIASSLAVLISFLSDAFRMLLGC